MEYMLMPPLNIFASMMDQVFQISNDDGLTVAQLLAKFNKDNGTDVKIVGYERFLAGA